MGATRGVLTGVLGLVAFQTVVQPAASKRVGGLLTDVASIVDRALDPGVALIPDLRTKSGGASAPITPGTPPGPPVASLAPSPGGGFVPQTRLPPVLPVPAPQVAPSPPS
jgi:hypothetical protein